MTATLAFSDLPRRLGPVLVASGLHLAAVTALWVNLSSPDTRPPAVPQQMWIDLAPPEPHPQTQPVPQPKELPKIAARANASSPATTAPTPAPVEIPAEPAAIRSAPAPTIVSPGSSPAAPTQAAPVITAPSFDAAYLNNPKPAYPMMARRLGEEGRVLLRVHISAEGRAEKIEVQTSSGSERLDQAARDTVTRWRFIPARRGDEPIAAWVTVPIYFKLEQ